MTAATAPPPAAGDMRVIVPVFGGGEDLDACLMGLRAADPSPGDILVVADRRGAARRRDRAVRRADVVVHRDAVAVAAAALADADAVVGSYDDQPTATNFLSQFKNLLNHHVPHHADPGGFTFWGACGAIRRQVLLDVGGFDADRYPEPSIEDIELGHPLRAAGYRLRVQPRLLATHRKRWTVRSLIRTDVRNRALPWSELILRSGGFDDDLDIDVRGRAEVGLTGGLLLGLFAVALARHRRRA